MASRGLRAGSLRLGRGWTKLLIQLLAGGYYLCCHGRSHGRFVLFLGCFVLLVGFVS